MNGIERVGLQKSLAIRGKEKRQWQWEQDDLNIVAVRANEDDGDLNVVTNFLLAERNHEGGSFCCPLPRIPVLTSHNAEDTRNGTAPASKVHTPFTPDKSSVCQRNLLPLLVTCCTRALLSLLFNNSANGLPSVSHNEIVKLQE